MRTISAAILTLAAAGAGFGQTYTQKTFAGGALPENVAATSASLGVINGVAVDKSGAVFLSLGEYHMVVRLDAASGMLARVAGNGAASPDQLSGPAGLAVDATGNLFIADAGNFRVRIVSGGVMAPYAGTGTQGYDGDDDSAVHARFDTPGGIAADAAGNLYIADFYNQVVRKVAGGKVTTVAGNGTFGYAGDNGPAVNAQLAGPSGVAVDSAGNLYIAEAYNNRVRKVSGGTITTVAGNGTAGFSGDKGAATSAALRQPADVAVDAAGNLYIADYGNNRIRMVTNGIISTVAGNGTLAFSGDGGAATSAGLAGPRRITVDAAGNLYIADATRVRKITRTVISTIAGGGLPAGENGPAAAAQLLSPQGMAVDAAGNLYFTDMGNGRVLKVAGGRLTRVAGSANQGYAGDNGPATSAQLSAPSGVAVDASGAIYVADSQNARVRKIAGGTITTFAGSGTTFGDGGPANKAQLTAPEGVAVDAAGTVYIADVNRVRSVAGGAINTCAGNGSVGYQGDGALATAARLSSPTGVAADGAGNLLIADSGNNRIRLVANGVITTVAGNGTYGFLGSNGTATSANLGTPVAVAADASGDLYLTDSYRVMKVSKGKLTTLAGLAGPQGIALDAAGNIYVADPANHRVVVLEPAGTSCAVTVTPASPVYPAAGGTFAITIQTGAACPWAIDNLPAWMSVDKVYSTGAATVTLAVAENTDAPRTAALAVGGQAVAITQAGVASIVGQVTLSTGKPLAGVTMTLSGAAATTVTTDAGGNYAFKNLVSTGTYTVTPSLAGYNFVAPSQTFTTLSATPTANFVAWLQPRVGGMGPVFGSALQPGPKTFAAGEAVGVYGTNLCGDSAAATPSLPDRLAACIVRVDSTPIRLYYASGIQINAVLPQTLAVGVHQLVVQRYSDTAYRTLAAQSEPYSFTVDRVSMAFLERSDSGTDMLLAQYLDGGIAGPARPLHAADYIVLYLTGLGRKAQTFTEGTAPGRASTSVETIQITVQGQAAQVLYSGVQPQFPGLDQVTLRIPQYVLAAGERTVTIQITAPATGQTVRYTLAAL